MFYYKLFSEFFKRAQYYSYLNKFIQYAILSDKEGVLKKNIFNIFTDKLLSVPFWVKQVLYLKLAKEMQDNCCENFLREHNQDIFSTFIPTLTFKGTTELTEKKCGLDNNIYNFLQYCSDGHSLLEISVNTFMSMEETAKYYEFCVEQNFLTKPDSKEICAMAGFISGKFRIGEYFEQNGTITPEQLQNTIKIYEDTNKSSNVKIFGEVLAELGYVKEEELKALLLLKEEAEKRFILDYNALPKTEMAYSSDNEKYKQEIRKLKEDNIKLKRKMSQLLELVRKHAD